MKSPRVRALVTGVAIAATVTLAGCSNSDDGGNPFVATPDAVSTTNPPVPTAVPTTTVPIPTETTPSEPTTAPPVPEQRGAATDPDEMTCGTFGALTADQQVATVKTIGERKHSVLITSNAVNSARMVLAFCRLDPNELVKDTLPMQATQ